MLILSVQGSSKARSLLQNRHEKSELAHTCRKAPRKRAPAFLRAQTDGLFAPFEAYLRQELPLHSQKSHPILLTFLGLRIKEPVCEGGQ